MVRSSRAAPAPSCSWRIDADRPIETFSVRDSPIRFFELSRDGRLMVAHHADGTLATINAATREVSAERKIERTHGFALSFDGQRAAMQSDGGLELLDTSTLVTSRTIEGYGVAQWLPSGELLASGRALSLLTPSGELQRGFAKGHSHVAFAVSPDGKAMIVHYLLNDSEHRLEIYDLASGKLRHRLNAEPFGGVTFSPDSKLAVSGGVHGDITLWDVATGRRVRTLAPRVRPVQRVSLSPSGRYLWTVRQHPNIMVDGFSKEQATYQLYDIRTDKVVASHPRQLALGGKVHWSADESRMAMTSYDGTRVFDVASGRQLAMIPATTDVASDLRR